MKWLERIIELDTRSMDWAVLIFSLLSLFCSVITILIYLRIKSLRTIIYKIFFLIAINETISRGFHILQFINTFIQSAFFLRICSIAIFFTDTTILLFLALSCYTMYQLIIKQNKKINIRFSLYGKIIFGLSTVLTIAFIFLIFQNNTNDIEDINLYGIIIALYFPKDKKRDKNSKVNTDSYEGEKLDTGVIHAIDSFYLIILAYTIFIVVMIQRFIKKREFLGYNEEDRFSENKFRQKTFKLKSFKNKMYQYPFIGFAFIFPLIVFSIIELKYKHKWMTGQFDNPNEEEGKEEEGILDFLRIRFIVYNINCFLNSIRGWLYFKIFISNEKIKIFLFKRYLTSSIFYTIDKIDKKREISASRNNSVSQQLESTDGSIFLEDSFESSKSSKSGRINSDSSDRKEENNELFEMQKDRSFDEENNNSLDDDDDDENVINPNVSRDSRSETLNIKVNKLKN